MNLIKKISAIIVSSILTTFILSPLAQADSNKNKLPNIGTSAFSTLSIDKERLIGTAMMKQLRASQPIINDPVLDEYINDLGNKLVKNAHDVHYSFEFFIINNKEINAFAFFGGHVGIHSEVITTADNESELASVLSHEISHVTQRHLARRLDAQKRNQPMSMVGMLSGVLIALVNPAVGFAALSTSMAVSQQVGINYTRANEQEADRVGIALLADSGFSPQAMPSFFTKLAAKYRYTSKPPAMLLTHPLTESRITDARARAQQYPSHPLAPSLPFELAKARIQARYEHDALYNISYYQVALKKHKYAIKQAANYGLALSYLQNKQFQPAQKILEKLYRHDPKNLFYVDALSDVYIGLKQFDDALVMLSSLNKLMPNNQVVSLNYANVLLEAKQYNHAAQILQDLLFVKPNNFLANDLLSTIYQKLGKKSLMHASKAEVYALLGAYPRAIDELQTAMNFSKSTPLVAKRIKARILQFQDLENKLKRL